MRGKGIAIDATRVGHYERTLAEIADYHERSAIDDLIARRGAPSLINALSESTEFVDIHTGLSRASDLHMVRKLRQFVRGAKMLRDETTAANQARNLGFELLLAASAASCGVKVNLEPPADLSLIGTKQRYFVECKRPFAEKALSDRIGQGLKQLRNRYSSAACPVEARGILAISVSRLVNHGSLMLNVSTAEVGPEMDRIFRLLVRRYSHNWLTGADPRTVAVLLELRTACQLTDLPLLVTLQHHVFVTLCERNSVDRQQLDEIMTKFAGRAAQGGGGQAADGPGLIY
jgi:hypothetical protein